MEQWFDPTLEVVEEYDFFVRIAYTWKLAYVDTVLARWRVHSNSWTWKKQNLFPSERRRVLKKLTKLIPNFKLIYEKEMYLVLRECDWEDAKLFWKEHKNSKARSLIKPYRKDGLKWAVYFGATYTPYWLFHFAERKLGNVYPS